MRIPVFSGLLLGLLVFSCGGEDKGPRVMPVNIGVDGQPLPGSGESFTGKMGRQ